MREFDLAQLNIGRLRAPTDSPIVAEFMEALEPINALADSSAGFVWRFQTAEGNATAERPFDDDTVLVNFSTWESIDALADYVYRTAHTEYLRRRREWFDRFDGATVVLWWVPAGHRPTVAEAIERLEHLEAHGPTPYAFTFRHRYEPGTPTRRRRTNSTSAPPDVTSRRSLRSGEAGDRVRGVGLLQPDDVVGGQLDVDRRHGIGEVVRLGRADDRRGDERLREHPRQRDLGARHAALGRDFGHPFDDDPIAR